MINKFINFYKYFSSKYQTVFLEYKVSPMPRFGHDLKQNSLLVEVINRNRNTYANILTKFLNHKDFIHTIRDSKVEQDVDRPTWNNGYLPGLDVIGIYGMIALNHPKSYIEIGSGNSTKIARKCISENNLKTKIISIDPFPRANIDHLADEVIRLPLEKIENVDFIIESLNENDILFIDNSHRVFPNSDSMICFLEILPYLKKGVIVHLHDIYLPFDYPQFMCDRFYNEQYFLAALLMGNSKKYCTILPNYFISQDAELFNIIAPIWKHENLNNVEKHGGSFWLRIE